MKLVKKRPSGRTCEATIKRGEFRHPANPLEETLAALRVVLTGEMCPCVSSTLHLTTIHHRPENSTPPTSGRETRCFSVPAAKPPDRHTQQKTNLHSCSGEVDLSKNLISANTHTHTHTHTHTAGMRRRREEREGIKKDEEEEAGSMTDGGTVE